MQLHRIAILSGVMLGLAACGGNEPASTAPERGDNGAAMAANGEGGATMSAIPDRFVGTWDADAEACAGRGSEMRLTVSPNRLRFYEGSATVRSVAPDGDGISVAATLDSEGMTEERRYGLARTGDGALVVTTNGSTATRVRCGG